MKKLPTFSIILLRVTVGWFFFYMGIAAILNPSWSILPQISDAHTFSVFYHAIINSGAVSLLSYIFKGLFVGIGALLILGIFVRIGCIVGVLVTLFFYFPLLQFPYVGSTSAYIVDDHFILVAILIFLYAVRAGEYLGLGSMFRFSRY